MIEAHLLGYYITEEDGVPLAIFPSLKRLRYLIPWAPVEEVIGYLRGLAESDVRPDGRGSPLDLALMGVLALGCSFFLLHEDLSLSGSLVALLTVAALLGVVVSGGVTASAIFSSTLLGITVLWITVYGAGFTLSLLPIPFPSPYQALQSLPYVLRGEYNLFALGRLIGWSAITSCVLALFGLASFSRRDV